MSAPATRSGGQGSFLRRRRVWLTQGAAAVLLAGGIVVMGGALLSESGAELHARVAEQIAGLEEDRDAAVASMTDAHEHLLNSLSGAKVERVHRDERLLRTLALRISETSRTSLRAAQWVQAFAEDYPHVADPRVLWDGFLPVWMNDTAGTIFALSSLDVQVTSVTGLDYGYTAIARLSAVSGSAGDQFLLITASTDVDGTLSDIDVSRLSAPGSAAFAADADDDASPDDEASAATSPTPEPSR